MTTTWSDPPPPTPKPNASQPSRPRFPLREHLLMAYPTPVVVYPWPDSEGLNAALKDIILAAEAAGPGVTKSNVGGWHSEPDLFTREDACVRTLFARIEAAMIELVGFFMAQQTQDQPLRFRVEGWANLLRSGGYNNIHNHPNAHWSGVYYVTGNPPIPGQPMSGKLEFIDPRPAATMLLLDNVTIYGRQLLDPMAGTMVIFPSWLQHQVHPYFGPDERISVSFNVIVAPVAAGSGGA